MATDLDENTITAEAFRRLENTPDPRLHEIMKALTKHLHDFARETKLTEDEWMKGIQFLTATGHKSTGTRQEMILLSDTLGLSQLIVAQSHSRAKDISEQTVLGPFFVAGAPKYPSHGAEIAKGSVGDPLHVRARVVDADGKPVADAVVDVWHAGADGFYDVQDAKWKLEESRLRGIFRTDSDGRFSYWTIMPLYYPIPTDGPVGEMIRATKRHPYRPAHIHYSIDVPPRRPPSGRLRERELGARGLVREGRLGADRLRDALAAFGRWFDMMREPLTQLSPNPLRWKANQERSLRVAERLKADGEFCGVGL